MLQRRASGGVDDGDHVASQVSADHDDGVMIMLCAEGRHTELTAMLRKRAAAPG